MLIMPERIFEIRWPDGQHERCYSPSSTIENYLTIGQEYSLELFLTVVEKALNEASERVRQKYGYACSSAMDQLRKIKHRASVFEKKLDSTVLVINIT